MHTYTHECSEFKCLVWIYYYNAREAELFLLRTRRLVLKVRKCELAHAEVSTTSNVRFYCCHERIDTYKLPHHTVIEVLSQVLIASSDGAPSVKQGKCSLQGTSQKSTAYLSCAPVFGGKPPASLVQRTHAAEFGIVI